MTAVFLQPFALASFDEVLPAGEYGIETEVMGPVDWIEPGRWTASVFVHLTPRKPHPGLSRTLTVPLTELEDAIAKDKVSGKPLTDYFLEEMLDDPMICLVMQADGVSEEEIRGLCAGRAGTNSGHSTALHAPTYGEKPDTDSERPHFSDRHVWELAKETRASSERGERIEPGTNRPIELDGRRTAEGKSNSEMRRKAVNWDTAPHMRLIMSDIDIDAALLIEPAQTWIEAMEKAAFLLGKYAATRDAEDPRIQKLIKRANSDMARLRKREEAQP